MPYDEAIFLSDSGELYLYLRNGTLTPLTFNEGLLKVLKEHPMYGEEIVEAIRSLIVDGVDLKRDQLEPMEALMMEVITDVSRIDSSDGPLAAKVS